jgi:hypothetical protein
VAGLTGENGGPDIGAVRKYFLAELDESLRRPEMMGGETGLQIYLDAVGFVHDLPRLLTEERNTLKSRGAFTPTGVRGAFECFWGIATDDMIASVYAEISWRHGWLEPDRPLTQDEHDTMVHRTNTWCGQDRRLSEVLDTFGPPSVHIGGSNPRFPKTLAYMTDKPDSPSPVLSFHLWNKFAPGTDEAEYPEPMVLAVRREGGLFADSFILTPMGRDHKNASISPG